MIDLEVRGSGEMKINILMSTYNGEKYLSQQIESIINQTEKNWHLIIRDDGSKDDTIAIIEKFINQDTRIELIRGENIGVIASFFQLTKYEKADFYFFCDQDDVWLPEKLKMMLDEAQHHEKQIPLLVYSDLKVVDRNLNILYPSMIKEVTGPACTNLKEVMRRNCVTGCASMINNALAEKWVNTEGIIMHDWYLAQIAAAYNNLIYLNHPTILYRQHENNVLGGGKGNLTSKLVDMKSNGYTNLAWREILREQKQLSHVFSILPETNENKKTIKKYLDVINEVWIKRFFIMLHFQKGNTKKIYLILRTWLIVTKIGYKKFRF